MRRCSAELHLMARTQVLPRNLLVSLIYGWLFFGAGHQELIRTTESSNREKRRMLMVGENHILHPAKNWVNSYEFMLNSIKMSLGNVIWHMSQMRQMSVSSLLNALKCSTCCFCWIAMSTLDG